MILTLLTFISNGAIGGTLYAANDDRYTQLRRNLETYKLNDLTSDFFVEAVKHGKVTAGKAEGYAHHCQGRDQARIRIATSAAIALTGYSGDTDLLRVLDQKMLQDQDIADLKTLTYNNATPLIDIVRVYQPRSAGTFKLIRDAIITSFEWAAPISASQFKILFSIASKPPQEALAIVQSALELSKLNICDFDSALQAFWISYPLSFSYEFLKTLLKDTNLKQGPSFRPGYITKLLETKPFEKYGSSDGSYSYRAINDAEKAEALEFAAAANPVLVTARTNFKNLLIPLDKMVEKLKAVPLNERGAFFKQYQMLIKFCKNSRKITSSLRERNYDWIDLNIAIDVLLGVPHEQRSAFLAAAPVIEAQHHEEKLTLQQIAEEFQRNPGAYNAYADALTAEQQALMDQINRIDPRKRYDAEALGEKLSALAPEKRTLVVLHIADLLTDFPEAHVLKLVEALA